MRRICGSTGERTLTGFGKHFEASCMSDLSRRIGTVETLVEVQR